MKNQIIRLVLVLSLCMGSAFAQSNKIHTGKVLETLNSGGYTYLKVLENTKTFWIAVRAIEVKKGDNFTFKEKMWMSNFTSKTLNRTFDKILFAKTVPSLNQPSVFMKDNQKAVSKNVVSKTILEGEIAIILANKKNLTNKVISVKGEVVKVSRGIMKTSWIHIKDKNNNKLIFRAKKESVVLGDKVTAKGTLNTNVDYGYGYTYEAIVVNSTFTKM